MDADDEPRTPNESHDAGCAKRDLDARQLLAVVHHERAAVAENLHRGVHQILTALMMRVGAGATANEQQMLVIRQLAEEASGALRAITNALVSTRGPGGLAQRLSELTRCFREHFDTPIVGPVDQAGLFPEAIEDAAFEAVQMVLTSTCSSSIADASVSLHASRTELRVLTELHAFTGAVADIEALVRTETFSATQGKVSAAFEGDIATIVLRFPLGGSQ